MIQTTNQDHTNPADNVEVSFYDIASLKQEYENWDEMSREERLEILESVEPDSQFTNHNVTSKDYREYLSSLLNPEISQSAVDVTHMAFGNDDTATDISDRHLVNEVMRKEIDDHIDRGTEYVGTVLLGGNDGVSLDLNEAALVTTNDPSNSDDMAANRVLLNDPNGRLSPKTSDYAVTVKIELDHLDDSEVGA